LHPDLILIIFVSVVNNYWRFFSMRSITHGILGSLILALLFIFGCTGLESKQSSTGPSRGDNPISGDLTNADITINDSKVVIGLALCGMVTVGGFVLLARQLARHHATVKPLPRDNPKV
jgi:hypothetical protein